MTDWENLFRPEDFRTGKPVPDPIGGVQQIWWVSEREAAVIANAILRKHLSEAPVVDLSDYEWQLLSGDFPATGNYKARLVCIEEVK